MMWMKDEQWENVMRTNLDSFFYVTRQVLNDMLMKRYGRIINIVSLSGLKDFRDKQIIQQPKEELLQHQSPGSGSGQQGYYSKCRAPGFIKTDMTENISEKDMKALIPVNRFGTPEEVAHLVAFFAHRKAAILPGKLFLLMEGCTLRDKYGSIGVWEYKSMKILILTKRYNFQDTDS